MMMNEDLNQSPPSGVCVCVGSVPHMLTRLGVWK